MFKSVNTCVFLTHRPFVQHVLAADVLALTALALHAPSLSHSN